MLIPQLLRRIRTLPQTRPTARWVLRNAPRCVGCRQSGSALPPSAHTPRSLILIDAESHLDCRAAPEAEVTSDGHKGYSAKSLGTRKHDAIVQTKAERAEADALQAMHWTISLLKRWLLGTHASAVSPKHLQSYLDEYAFRHNRRGTQGVGRIAARAIEQLVASAPITMRMLVENTVHCRRLLPVSA
jgi:ISXO2-like transposase domain